MGSGVPSHPRLGLRQTDDHEVVVRPLSLSVAKTETGGGVRAFCVRNNPDKIGVIASQ